MLEKIEVLCHNSIRFSGEKIVYIDPFQITKEYQDADFIFITHSHYDHFSEEDIQKVKKENTKIIITSDLYDKTKELGFRKEDILQVKPDQKHQVEEISFKTIPAYNINKNFHPKENQWVGYLLNLNNIQYYIAGDTDLTEENRKITCDVAFVPVGGTYTMTAKEAAKLINEMKPKIAVPVHYGAIVGSKKDAEEFIQQLTPEIEGKILIK